MSTRERPGEPTRGSRWIARHARPLVVASALLALVSLATAAAYLLRGGPGIMTFTGLLNSITYGVVFPLHVWVLTRRVAAHDERERGTRG